MLNNKVCVAIGGNGKQICWLMDTMVYGTVQIIFELDEILLVMFLVRVVYHQSVMEYFVNILNISIGIITYNCTWIN